MSEGEFDVYYTVQARDQAGRYVSKLTAAITRGIEETLREGETVAKERATIKTGAMRDSIDGVMTSARSGELRVGTDHWKYQEDGTPPHSIPGNVTFWWANQGRMWHPGSNIIRHPGNAAVRFMAAARDVMRNRMAANIRAGL